MIDRWSPELLSGADRMVWLSPRHRGEIGNVFSG